MLMKLFYELLRFLFKTTFPLFYRQHSLRQAKYPLELPDGGIVASNHPTTLLDPLNTAKHFPFQVKFLTNYGMFKTPFTNWLFRTFYSLPIQRKEDMVGTGLTADNSVTFSASTIHLAQKGHLFMAPEGTCLDFRHVLQLKSGITRILFSAEAAHDFKLGLSIYPIGLSIWRPYDYRQRVLIAPGEPIHISEYKELYATEPARAMRDVQNRLLAQFKALTIHCESDQDDKNLYTLEDFAHAPKHDNGISLEHRWQTAKNLQAGLVKQAEEAPEKLKKLSTQLKIWQRSAEPNRLEPRIVMASTSNNLVKLIWGAIQLPLFAIVMLITALPQGLVARLPIWLKADVSYYPTFRIVGKYLLMPISALIIYFGSKLIGGFEFAIWAIGTWILAMFIRDILYNYFYNNTLPIFIWTTLKTDKKKSLQDLAAAISDQIHILNPFSDATNTH
jgi:glycerol-3-phosphate O-acyltransferase / dihydroxyacetone phosphate acyltransferase